MLFVQTKDQETVIELSGCHLFLNCLSCRPYQHGADMLAAISQVLNECTKPDQATPAALVLQGLHALCQAEVGSLNWLV